MKQSEDGSRGGLDIVKQLILAAFMLTGMMAANAKPLVLPSTFDTTIGYGLLCLDELDINYYYRYLSEALGKPYKHAGGAYWFKLNKVKLWKVSVSDILVSDGKGTMLFLAAIAKASPEKLEQAIAAESGIHFRRTDAGVYPRRASNTGSNIVYLHKDAEVYCGKSSYLLPQSR